MITANSLAGSDLFVLLEKAFRRRTKRCGRCVFSFPFRVPAQRTDQPNWAVIPSEGCTENCRLILEDVVRQFQDAYRLSDTGRFYPVLGFRGGD